MAADPWLTEFRAMHEHARKGELSAQDRLVYNSAREQLARTLTKIQGLTLRPGETARQTFRVALALQCEMALPEGAQKVVTMDVSRGGFSAMMSQIPEVKENLGFTLKMPGGANPVTGHARLVDARKQVGNFRVSWAFMDLAMSEVDRIEFFLFDSVLTRLGV
ncbi:MAG: PilZ domain-containing protein [Myxococcaceae bacterium]